MKKFMLIFAALVVGFASCTKDGQENFIPNANEYTNTVSINASTFNLGGLSATVVEDFKGFNEPVFVIKGEAVGAAQSVKEEETETITRDGVLFNLVIPVSNFDRANNLLDTGTFGVQSFGKVQYKTVLTKGVSEDVTLSNVTFLEKTIFGQRTGVYDNGTLKGLGAPKTARYYVSIPAAYEKIISIYVVYEDALKNRYVLSYKGKYNE